MQRHVVPAVYLSLLLLAITGVSRAAEPASALCQSSALPADIQQSLGKYFQGWKIQDPASLTPDMAAHWQAEAPNTCPGIMSGHFESKRRIDYMLLMIDPSTQGYRLVAFREQTAGLYGFKVLELAASGGASRFLRALSPAMRASASLPESREGVVLVSSDSRGLIAMFYYWNNDDFMRQQVPYPSG